MMQENQDVNKVFEDLLFAEEIAQKSGYEKGYASGQEKLLKGYHLGYHRASIIAARLGYYHGILEQYLQNTDTNCDKAVAIAKKLSEEIYDILSNHLDDNMDILKSVEDIKFKYAKFCTIAKISLLYPEVDKLQF